MKKEYIIAYDCGTTALKTVLISSDGTVIGDARADNPLIQKAAGWAEIEPDVIWENICNTTKQVIYDNDVNPKNVTGLVFVAHWKNIIPVGRIERKITDAVKHIHRQNQQNCAESGLLPRREQGEQFFPQTPLLFRNQDQPFLGISNKQLNATKKPGQSFLCPGYGVDNGTRTHDLQSHNLTP